MGTVPDPPPPYCCHPQLEEGSTTSVRTSYGTTPPCPLQKGVWQGCMLSPYLFIIVVEYVMIQARKRFACIVGGEPGVQVAHHFWHGGAKTEIRLADIIYADDTDHPLRGHWARARVQLYAIRGYTRGVRIMDNTV
eukprot:jgi/Mesvir1/8947/Mv26061-RA.1